jgi:hypothetical protein
MGISKNASQKHKINNSPFLIYTKNLKKKKKKAKRKKNKLKQSSKCVIHHHQCHFDRIPSKSIK